LPGLLRVRERSLIKKLPFPGDQADNPGKIKTAIIMTRPDILFFHDLGLKPSPLDEKLEHLMRK
jgi:hypothetical protein